MIVFRHQDATSLSAANIWLRRVGPICLDRISIEISGVNPKQKCPIGRVMAERNWLGPGLGDAGRAWTILASTIGPEAVPPVTRRPVPGRRLRRLGGIDPKNAVPGRCRTPAASRVGRCARPTTCRQQRGARPSNPSFPGRTIFSPACAPSFQWVNSVRE